MNQWLDMIILAIVQGIAEFLPISSSGHLVLVGALLGDQRETPVVEIILHAGTLASILVVYWRRILSLMASDRRVVALLVVGTIPAAIVGVGIKLFAPWLIKSPLLAGCMLLVTAAMLWTLRRVPQGETSYLELSWWKALAIGCFQAFAILPGVSRAGSTIFGARLLGLRNEDSVTFSFLLAIPAILGATVLTVKDLVDEGTSGEAITLLAVGAGISFVVGIASLRWLIWWSREGKLHRFAYWCAPVGLLVILLYASGFIQS